MHIWHSRGIMRITAIEPKRGSADLMAAAAAAGAREGRSAQQQLDHWARIGRAANAQRAASRIRIEAARSGALELAELTAEEAARFNTEVQARLEESLRSTHLGDVLNTSGVATVSIDASGNLVEHRPGTERRGEGGI